jgi:EAL domain-containing protein (putative c-di-GMP-specific phosphodiesterase class I)/GGDEF domain-containing protein
MQFLHKTSSKQLKLLDDLTGIYNRQGFFAATEQLLSDYPDIPFCIIYWNIRKFRVTNDLFGWDSGNQVLIHWANTLRGCLHDEYAVYGRLEHDNFVCCVPERFLDNKEWTKLGEISYSAGDTEYHFFSCCGLYRVTDRSVPITTMLDKARVAMESIKNNYMTLYAWYDEEMWQSLLEEQRMNSEFKTAIAEKQFQVYYQPICRASDGLITSAEALIRWIHPTRGMISPGAFIPLFEKNGFISILDRYVWDEVCAMQQARLDQGLSTVPVSVNVSRVEFYNPTLCEDIRDIAKSHNVSPDLVKIEITESAYADNPVQVQEAVKKLHGYGFTVLMDDFGSGYSSLNMLKDLPIDILKIDMRFLDDLEESQKASIVLESIIRLAKWMKLGVVSEGVETQREWEYLRSVECDSVQGYYFYRPMPREDFMQLLDRTAENSTDLLFHALPDLDDSIMDMFQQTNTRESILFHSMLGGMGLLELTEDNVELIRANSGYYEALYNYVPKNRHSLNIPFRATERDIISEQCRIAKEESTVQQFQLHHKREDGVYVWLNIKLRFIGGSAHRSLFLFSADNIDDLKREEHERYLNNYSSALLNIFDRVYHLNYDLGAVELLHVTENTGDVPEEFTMDIFLSRLSAVCSPEDLEKLTVLKDKKMLHDTITGSGTNCLTIHYQLPSEYNYDVVAYFFKVDLPDGRVRYLCCVKNRD